MVYILYISLTCLVYTINIQQTVNWFDGDSMLDEASINVDERYWHTIRATPYLSQLEGLGYCSIGCPKLSLTLLRS